MKQGLVPQSLSNTYSAIGTARDLYPVSMRNRLINGESNTYSGVNLAPSSVSPKSILSNGRNSSKGRNSNQLHSKNLSYR